MKTILARYLWWLIVLLGIWVQASGCLYYKEVNLYIDSGNVDVIFKEEGNKIIYFVHTSYATYKLMNANVSREFVDGQYQKSYFRELRKAGAYQLVVHLYANKVDLFSDTLRVNKEEIRRIKYIQQVDGEKVTRKVAYENLDIQSHKGSNKANASDQLPDFRKFDLSNHLKQHAFVHSGALTFSMQNVKFDSGSIQGEAGPLNYPMYYHKSRTDKRYFKKTEGTIKDEMHIYLQDKVNLKQGAVQIPLSDIDRIVSIENDRKRNGKIVGIVIASPFIAAGIALIIAYSIIGGY